MKKRSIDETIKKVTANEFEGNPEYRMLADGYYVSNDTHKTRMNNNDIVCGGTGRMKTTSYVEPLISQKCGSMIISDTKNTLYERHADELKHAGYKVYKLDMVNGQDSCSYNVLEFIRYDAETDTYNERDIVALAHLMCNVKVKDDKDPFWRSSTEIILSSILSYVLESTPIEEHHMGTVNKLINVIFDMRKYNVLMMEHASEFPDSFAVARYNRFKTVLQADRTYACIMMFLATAVNNYDCKETRNVFYNRNTVDFEKLGQEKCAFFLNVSDIDGSMNNIISIFYRDIFGKLIRYADSLPEKRLPVPVRFIMDDYSAGCPIEDFSKIISVIRSREISVSIIIQSITQLEELYTENETMTILANADHFLFLGTSDNATAEYIGKKMNQPYYKILNLPLDDAYLFEAGNERGGMKVNKYIQPYMRGEVESGIDLKERAAAKEKGGR